MTSARRSMEVATTLLIANEAFAQDSILPPPPQILTTTWFYWVFPLFATLLALAIGMGLHATRVRRSADAWPAAERTFSALCTPSVIVIFIAFGVVMATFAWVAFSPRTTDEWVLHRTVAISSVGVGLLLCSFPWILARLPWKR